MAFMETLSPASLPDDVDALKAMVIESTQVLHDRDAELHALSLMVEKLKHQLALLRRSKFGSSSEGIEQLVDRI
jgi:hypothetical protein